MPFVPYEIRTLSGQTYQIPHPDFILVPPKGSYVVVIDPKDPKEAPNHISVLLIERATLLDGQRLSLWVHASRGLASLEHGRLWTEFLASE